MDGLDAWREWKQRCALALCGEEARHVLTDFVSARFTSLVADAVRGTPGRPLPCPIPAAGECWHRFETHFLLHRGPGGKSYKDWLFTNPREPGEAGRDAVEAGATVLLRDVAREYLRRECAPRRTVPFNRPAEGNADGVLSPEDLLPAATDTARDVEGRELRRLARADAAEAFARLDRRERVALLAHGAGLSLAHPEILRAAGCRHSVLNRAFHSALSQVADCVRDRHPRDDRGVQAELACRILEEVLARVFSWGRAENGCDQLCMMEGRNRS